MARERGEGKLGLIVFLAFIAIVVFLAFKYVPPRVNAYEFKEFVEQTAMQAPYDSRATPENITIKLIEKAHELKIPLEEDAIEVQKTGESCAIAVIIKIPIDFAVTKYTLVLDCSTNSKAAT
jgi:hypothetical protein